MAMNTTVAFGSGYHGSSDRKTLSVFQPETKTAREPEHVVIRLPSARRHPEVAEARVPVPKSAIWERLELGFVVVLALAVIVSVLLFFAAAGGDNSEWRSAATQSMPT
jgi:hypothetical protein